ncbi:MAG: DNA adenine methylase [Spirochaetia bacterium]|jgi:adenine-specific DNA-methyltransferase|nr:DNA adenine methylase [Spirochaetia bacterium]
MHSAKGQKPQRAFDDTGSAGEENPAYLNRQLITYLGNKRALLPFIGRGLEEARRRLGKTRLALFDVFSGSGIVSRFFRKYSSLLVANDCELYATIISRCYLHNADRKFLRALAETHAGLLAALNEKPLRKGILSRLYAPRDDNDIRPGERVFYTARNARYIDTARKLIGKLQPQDIPFFLAPLLSEASIHANTSGVFKGFYKCQDSGTGRFGGTKADALSRILGNITLPFPVFSSFSCPVRIFQEDAALAAEKAPEVDLAYLDPPYNQHPYGSNYFMLNLIAEYREPRSLSPVSGIPQDWNRSAYNSRVHARDAFAALVQKLKAKFLLISFNSEGFIPREEMLALLRKTGKVSVLQTRYNAFRGSRNLKARDIHTTEYLYLVERR